MNTKKRIILGVAGLVLATLTTCAVNAQPNSGTFRTTGYFVGVTQGTNPKTGNPVYQNASFAGHNLVNLAMGRSENDTNYPNQVMAMSIAPDLSSITLVVYDESSSNIVATIAQSTAVDTVKQQDKKQPGPNRAQFVAIMLINPGGNDYNAIGGGYLTLSGRVNLDPATGAPAPVNASLDTDAFDDAVGDVEVPGALDRDSVRSANRTGLGHVTGVLDIINNGNTETILVPNGNLSIRRALPLLPSYTGTS